jgi:hypothetical protein
MTELAESGGTSPWVCSVCERTIAPGAGAVEIRAPTAEQERPPGRWAPWNQGQDIVPFGTGPLPWWMREDQPLVVQVLHPECGGHRGACTYRIPVERAATLQQWCAWVLELWPNTWLSRADLHRLLALWFSNRGIDHTSLT